MKKIISKSFYFEAAHKLNITENEENINIHGHSYFVEIFIIDYIDQISKKGLILDFSIFNERINIVKKNLDHRFLNKIDGLENPTLENIGLYIYKRLKELDLSLYKILVKRKSCGETFILKV
jgi:6-pyruvoyltetrahydropterin/6-carboxytetrahydropterin synthase